MAETEFRAVRDHPGEQPTAEAALASAGLARIALRRGNLEAARRESLRSVSQLDRVRGLYDVRVAPELWLVRSEVLLRSGDGAGARKLAAQALEASMRYDDPASAAIVAATQARRTAGG